MKRKRTIVIIWVCIIILLFAGVLITKPKGKHGSINEVMRDAVLHDINKVSLWELLK